MEKDKYDIETGKQLSSADIKSLFGGGQDVIRYNKTQNVIGLLTENDSSREFNDHWEGNYFYYAAQSLKGVQKPSAGKNKRINESPENGTRLFLITKDNDTYFFRGEFKREETVKRIYSKENEDSAEQILFKLMPVNPLPDGVKLPQDLVFNDAAEYEENLKVQITEENINNKTNQPNQKAKQEILKQIHQLKKEIAENTKKINELEPKFNFDFLVGAEINCNSNNGKIVAVNQDNSFINVTVNFGNKSEEADLVLYQRLSSKFTGLRNCFTEKYQKKIAEKTEVINTIETLKKIIRNKQFELAVLSRQADQN